MAATDTPGGTAAARLAAAALALPLALAASEAGAFERVDVGVKYLDYVEDGRMHARAPLLYVDWQPDADTSLHFSGDIDTISGASPHYTSDRGGAVVHALSGASIRDRRKGVVVRGSRSFADTTAGLGYSESRENDWVSRTWSGDLRHDFNQRNTTLALGVARTEDEIGASINALLNEPRGTNEFLIGVTQLLSPRALIQSNLSYADGSGYFNDPYKYALSFGSGRAPVVHQDQRPRERASFAWLTRYRHHFPAVASTLRLDYRYFRDDWGIRAHTLDLGLSHDLNPLLRIEPALRYYTQGAASFYGERHVSAGDIGSSDARLAAFGAWTASLRLEWKLNDETSLDATLAAYRQRAAWRAGSGTAGFPDLDARILMVGLSHRF